MAKTVVGLFDSIDDAQSVSSELRGVRGTDVNLVSREVYGGSDSDISDMVTGAGVPSSDARLYVQGVRQGATLVVAQTDDNHVNQVVDIMNRHNIVDIESRRSMYSGGGTTMGASADVTRATINTGTTDTSRTSTAPATNVDTSYTGTTGTRSTGTRTNTVNTGDEIAVPIVEEQLNVGKREVDRGGVRVNTRVEEVPVEEQVTLRDEHVDVQRRPVNQPASAADLDAFKEGTLEVRETDEEAIVGKQARVVEEVVIRKEAEERTETVRDTVRRTDVDVEQIPGQTSTTGTTSTTGGSTMGTTGTTGSTGSTGSGRSLTDRIEGATGRDIDRDGDVGGNKRRS